jgi:hypothetical protein
MSPGEHRTFIAIGTGCDARAVYCRFWEVPGDGESAEKLAAALTEICGEPFETVSDEAGFPGRPAERVLFGGPG